jgi:hypothetical protein
MKLEIYVFTSFVASVAAIVFRVAFPGGRDTAAVVASELGSVTGDVDAARLVRRVAAVVVRVAAERVGDAATRRALELVRRASRLGAVLVLVRIVQAIVVAVADPRLRDAALVVAGEIPDVGAGLDGRLRPRIENASLPVRREFLPVRTSAFRRQSGSSQIRRDGETKFLASAIVRCARMAGNDVLENDKGNKVTRM